MIGRVCHLIKMMIPESNRGLLWASKARVPDNAVDVDGYQGGCIWINTAGAAGTGVWTNEGSVTAASWIAFDTSAGAGAGTITFDDDTTGPLISLETVDPTGAAYLNPFLITGTYASSCSKGIKLSATNLRPVSFLFDNHSAALGAGDYRAVLSRVYLCSDQGNAITLNAMRAQIKLADLADITSASSVTAPFTGYLELAGTGARTLNGHVACVRAALEEGASGTTTIGTLLVGFEATLNSTRTYAGSGILAAYVANISGGTSTWQYGLAIEAGAASNTGVYVGAGPTWGFDVQARSRVGTHNWGAASGIAPVAGATGGILEVATSIATDIAAGAYASIYANTAITSSIAGDVSAFGAWHELYFNGTDLTLAASNYAATWSVLDVTDAGADATFGGLGAGPANAQLWLAGHTIVFNSDAQLKLSAYRDAAGLLVQSGITAGYDKDANANFAAILITRASSAGAWKEPWPVGVQISPLATDVAFKLGTASYASSGTGLPLDGTTIHSGAEIFFDDGGVKLAAGYTEAWLTGFLVSTAVTSAAVSCSAVHDYIYIAADVETSGTFSGSWSSMLVKTGMTITAVGGVADFPALHLSVDVPAGATIAASTFACGLSIGGQLGGTHTGNAIGIRLRTANGGWDGLFDVTSQVVTASVDAAGDGEGSIAIFVAGVKKYLQYWPSATA